MGATWGINEHKERDITHLLPDRTPDRTPGALLPVGRDCDCGFPLVWHRNHQICAVYGTHPPPLEPLRINRDYNAPLAWLVDELDRMPMPANCRRARRADYQGSSHGDA